MKYLLYLIVTLLLGTEQSQSFKKEPYLLYTGNNTSMTIIWQLNAPASSTIQWGVDQSYSNSDAVSEYGNDHQFKYTINKLVPGQKYFYKVEAGSTVKASTFYAAPDDTAASVTFYIYGDTRSHPEVQNTVTGRILTEINNEPSSQTFCLITGDCVNKGGVESDWQDQFFNPSFSNNVTLKSEVPFIIARGNHENYNGGYNSGNATVFYKYWPYTYASGSTNGDDMYWSFDYGPVHIAVVDQYDNGSFGKAKLSATQLAWLQTDLSLSDKPWKFILLHEPGWSARYTSSVSREHGNNKDVQDNIQPLCVQNNIQAVFGGHNHYYAHCLVNGVNHFTLGGGGAPLYNPSHTSGGVVVYAEKTYHFMKVAIQGNKAVLSVIKPDGSEVESINLTAPVSVPGLNEKENIKVYPNPASGKIILHLDGKAQYPVLVRDMLGRTLITMKPVSSVTTIDLSNFNNGLYFLQVERNGKWMTKKIVKK